MCNFAGIDWPIGPAQSSRPAMILARLELRQDRSFLDIHADSFSPPARGWKQCVALRPELIAQTVQEETVGPPRFCRGNGSPQALPVRSGSLAWFGFIAPPEGLIIRPFTAMVIAPPKPVFILSGTGRWRRSGPMRHGLRGRK